MVATASADASDSLEWRGGRSEIKIATPATSSFASSATRFHSDTSSTAAFTNPLRASTRRVDFAVRQAAFEERAVPGTHDLAVRQVAFEDAGPQFGASDVRSADRSVIVREEEPNAFRAAQLESPGRTDAQFDEDLRGPLTDTQLPPLEEPPIEDLETPTVPDTTPQPETTPQQPSVQQQRQPGAEFQPGIAPRPGIAQPLPEQAPQLSEETIEQERQRSSEACDEGLEDLREKTIDKLNLKIVVTGEPGSDFPYECTLGDAQHEGRCWEQNTYMWKASALCHKPLYFEDEQLERYGHSFPPCFQPFVSGAHFFCTLPVLPYCMGVEPPCECVYALGHYRPGNCAPYMCNPIPISPRGALFQAGAVVGTAAILP